MDGKFMYEVCMVGLLKFLNILELTNLCNFNVCISTANNFHTKTNLHSSLLTHVG